MLGERFEGGEEIPAVNEDQIRDWMWELTHVCSWDLTGWVWERQKMVQSSFLNMLKARLVKALRNVWSDLIAEVLLLGAWSRGFPRCLWTWIILWTLQLLHIIGWMACWERRGGGWWLHTDKDLSSLCISTNSFSWAVRMIPHLATFSLAGSFWCCQSSCSTRTASHKLFISSLGCSNTNGPNAGKPSVSVFVLKI